MPDGQRYEGNSNRPSGAQHTSFGLSSGMGSRKAAVPGEVREADGIGADCPEAGDGTDAETVFSMLRHGVAQAEIRSLFYALRGDTEMAALLNDLAERRRQCLRRWLQRWKGDSEDLCNLFP
jgi:hypothetical protein